VVVVLHGVGGNKQWSLVPARMLRSLGYGVLVFDFRAHGDSGGSTVTYGMREALDVKAAHEWLVRRQPGVTLFALGYSMGGAALLSAAGETPLFSKLVVDSTFSRMPQVAERSTLAVFGPLRTPVWHLARLLAWVGYGVDFAENQPGACVPAIVSRSALLVIHCAEDRIVPVSEAEELSAKAEGTAELWRLSGCGHVGALTTDAGYRERVGRFFGD